jgi:cytochrome c oxidase cbb3-type subunit 3
MFNQRENRGIGRPRWVLGLAFALLGCTGHTDFPGRPRAEPEVADPRTVMSFAKLYGANCAGCHGARGQGGPALALASPSYLAWVPEAELRRAIAQGRPHTAMPAFAQRAGGMLTEAQVDALVAGVKAWAPAPRQADADLPPYQAGAAGDPVRGARAFANLCASCHGGDGRGAEHIGSIVDPSFLELVSDQALRSTIIAGRSELGCPGARSRGGTAPSAADVSDMVAWLVGHRRETRAEPYRSAQADEKKP